MAFRTLLPSMPAQADLPDLLSEFCVLERSDRCVFLIAGLCRRNPLCELERRISMETGRLTCLRRIATEVEFHFVERWKGFRATNVFSASSVHRSGDIVCPRFGRRGFQQRRPSRFGRLRQSEENDICISQSWRPAISRPARLVNSRAGGLRRCGSRLEKTAHRTSWSGLTIRQAPSISMAAMAEFSGGRLERRQGCC